MFALEIMGNQINAVCKTHHITHFLSFIACISPITTQNVAYWRKMVDTQDITFLLLLGSSYVLKAKFVIGDTIQTCVFMAMVVKIEVFFIFGALQYPGL